MVQRFLKNALMLIQAGNIPGQRHKNTAKLFHRFFNGIQACLGVTGIWTGCQSGNMMTDNNVQLVRSTDDQGNTLAYAPACARNQGNTFIHGGFLFLLIVMFV